MTDGNKDWVVDDAEWSPKAWMSTRDADLFEAVLLTVARRAGRRIEVLEWGAGRSTSYFTRLLQSLGMSFRWLALEYDREFFDGLTLPGDPDGITTAVHVDAENSGTVALADTPSSPFCLEYTVFNYGRLLPMLAAHAEDRKVRMDPYVRFPGSTGRTYDLVLVDGRHRRDCLVHARHWLADDGVVALHDAYRPYYHCAFDAYPWHSFAGDMLWFGSGRAQTLPTSGGTTDIKPTERIR